MARRLLTFSLIRKGVLCFKNTHEALSKALNAASAAPMAGLEPENILVEVTGDGRLILHGDQRALLKEVKELLVDEWSVGVYHRELALPVPVNAVCANVTYSNGVLMVALPISDQTSPAQLALERVTSTHGQHRGNAGHLATCVQT